MSCYSTGDSQVQICEAVWRLFNDGNATAGVIRRNITSPARERMISKHSVGPEHISTHNTLSAFLNQTFDFDMVWEGVQRYVYCVKYEERQTRAPEVTVANLHGGGAHQYECGGLGHTTHHALSFSFSITDEKVTSERMIVIASTVPLDALLCQCQAWGKPVPFTDASLPQQAVAEIQDKLSENAERITVVELRLHREPANKRGGDRSPEDESRTKRARPETASGDKKRATIVKIRIDYRPSLAVKRRRERELEKPGTHIGDPWLHPSLKNRVLCEFTNDSFDIKRDFRLVKEINGVGGHQKSWVTFSINHYNRITEVERERIQSVLVEAFELAANFPETTDYTYIFTEIHEDGMRTSSYISGHAQA